MLTKRTNILFDEKLWKKLTLFSKKQKVSIGELVRRAVTEKFFDENLEQRRKAFENIMKIRKISKTPIDYKELINHGRKY